MSFPLQSTLTEDMENSQEGVEQSSRFAMSLPLHSTLTEDMKKSQGVEQRPVLNVPETDGDDLAAAFESVHLSRRGVIFQHNLNTISEYQSDRMKELQRLSRSVSSLSESLDNWAGDGRHATNRTEVYMPAVKSYHRLRSRRRKERVANVYLGAPSRHRPY